MLKYIVNCLDKIQKKTDDVKFEYYLKTNGTILTDNIISFLNEKNIDIQISLDGDKESHDSCRKKINGQGTFDIVVSNINRLLCSRQSMLNKKISLLATITNNSNIYTILETLKSFGINYQFTPATSSNEWKTKDLINEYSIERVFTPFMKQFQSELNEGKIDFNNNTLIGYLKNLYNRNSYSRTCIAGHKSFCFGINGEIYLCHRFINNPLFVLGSIDNDLINHEKANKCNYPIAENNNCKECGLIYLCSGTCAYERVIRSDYSYVEPIVCSFVRFMYSGILSTLLEYKLSDPDNYKIFVDKFRNHIHSSSKRDFLNNVIIDSAHTEEIAHFKFKKIIGYKLFELNKDNSIIVNLKNPEKKYYINSVSKDVWELIDDFNSASEILIIISEKYDISPKDIMHDIFEQIQIFAELGFIVKM